MEVNIKVDSNDLGKQIETDVVKNVNRYFELKQEKLFIEINKKFSERIDNLADVLTQGIDEKIVRRLKHTMATNLTKWIKGVKNEC